MVWIQRERRAAHQGRQDHRQFGLGDIEDGALERVVRIAAFEHDRVMVGPAGADEFFNSIPQSFIEGLNPEVFG